MFTGIKARGDHGNLIGREGEEEEMERSQVSISLLASLTIHVLEFSPTNESFKTYIEEDHGSYSSSSKNNNTGGNKAHDKINVNYAKLETA